LVGIIDDYFDGYFSEEMIESQVPQAHPVMFVLHIGGLLEAPCSIQAEFWLYFRWISLF
jgi:hypothetical protein